MLNPLSTKCSLGIQLENMKNGITGFTPNPGRIEALLVSFIDSILRNDRKAKGLTEEEIMVMFYRYFGSQAFETYDRVVDEEKLNLVEYDEGDYTFMTEAGEEMLYLKENNPATNKVMVRGVKRKMMPWDVIGRYMNLTPRQAKSRFESGRSKIEAKA